MTVARGFVTEKGTPFVPFGVTYYRPGTGWAPQVWKQFDAEATRVDFKRMKTVGINCVRVFLSYGSFYRQSGVLDKEGLAKFDRFIELAEAAGIYVHPTGPDHWEGSPNWGPVSVQDKQTLHNLEAFWKQFVERYHGRKVIFAYDLKNEPEVGWEETMSAGWNRWLQQKYGKAANVAVSWGTTNKIHFGEFAVPAPKDALGSRQILDFQQFREELADEWTRGQVAAIKEADPEALVTVGLIQWSIPVLLPAGPQHYSGFRPERQARFLDFLEIHFYPLAQGAYEYRTEAEELANLSYLESVVREAARPGKPLVLAEFGWYGGGKPKFDSGRHPEATGEQQARFCSRVVDTSTGFAVGWLNWGLYDQPEASDCSELTGLFTAQGKLKAWGLKFQELSAGFKGKRLDPPRIGGRPKLDWNLCLTSSKAGQEFRDNYLRAFLADRGSGPSQKERY